MSDYIDVPHIDSESLGKLSGMYAHAAFMQYGDDLMHASFLKKKMARRWITKHYCDQIDELPADIASMFDSFRSDDEVLQFLRECHDRITSEAQRFRNDLIKETADAVDNESEAVKSAVQELFHWGSFLVAEVEGCLLKIVITECPNSYCQSLILYEVENFPSEYDGRCLEDIRLKKKRGQIPSKRKVLFV